VNVPEIINRMAKRFILLDRDGTIIVEKNYLASPDAVALLPNAAAGLRMLRSLGFGLVVVSNQSGIGRSYFTTADAELVHLRLKELLAQEGVALEGIYFCPHTPESACDCRKPEPGLVLRAAADLQFAPPQAIVIGDKPADIALGKRLGAKTVLVKTGYGCHYPLTATPPDLVAEDLLAAAHLIAGSPIENPPRNR
jgi:D-glycero-D-manno-heptose 1,7-bisphosphate phosphatase